MTAQANQDHAAAKAGARIPSRTHPSGNPFPRRTFLKTGAAGAALAITQAGRACAGTPPTADAAILIWLQGGLSHIDTFDPKPQGPGNLFQPIETSIPGVRFSELLPRTAEVADKLCVIRSMSHDYATHEQATHAMLTGCDLRGGRTEPCFMSIIASTLGANSDMPAYVADPGTSYTARLGFLNGGSHRQGLDSVRITDLPPSFNCSNDREDSHTVRRYGPSDLGERLLRARRLVEAGVRCVVVDDAGWDHHANIESAYRRRVPKLDRAFAALIGDLYRRGMLERTLVMLLTESGRTNTLNATRGRDECGSPFSVILAGGGIANGSVVGQTDTTGSVVERGAVSPDDLVTTVYRGLNLDLPR